MTDTHRVVNGYVVCGFCGYWRYIDVFAAHLRDQHGAPPSLVLEGEIRTLRWPEPTTPTVADDPIVDVHDDQYELVGCPNSVFDGDDCPTPDVEDLPSPTDLLTRMQQDRDVRWERELRLAAINAASQSSPRWEVWGTHDLDNIAFKKHARTLRFRADRIYQEFVNWIG